MQLWRHNEGTYDVMKITLIPYEESLLCDKFQFFRWCGFRDRVPKFFRFSNMVATPRDLLRHNYHWNILHEYSLDGENLVSIWQAVAQKNTKIL